MIDEDGVITTPFLRTRFNYDTNKASKACALCCSDATRTQQQFKDECDINTIVRQFGLTGMLPTNLQVPLNEQFVDVMDYQTSLNALMEADKAFMALPADIRNTFQNDAGRFVDFVSDPKNVDQCRKWGLAIEEAKVAAPVPVPAPTPAPGATT